MAEAGVTDLLARAISDSFHEEGYIEGLSDPSEWAEFLKAGRECLAALDAAGFQIVPKEPTEAMIKRAVENEGADAEWARIHYRTMLAAVPKL